jgi:hypothetical protein
LGIAFEYLDYEKWDIREIYNFLSQMDSKNSFDEFVENEMKLCKRRTSSNCWAAAFLVTEEDHVSRSRKSLSKS